MKGSLRKMGTPAPSFPPSDLAAESGGGTMESQMRPAEKFELAGADGLRSFSRQDEIAEPVHLMDESTSTEWTDEKHSLYLDSMEASFVEEFYNHKDLYMDLLSWYSDKKNRTNNHDIANSHKSSGQFKVLRDGSWQEVNCRRDQPKFSAAAEALPVMESPWIRHFRPALGTSAMHNGRRRKSCDALEASSNTCGTHLRDQVSVAGIEEMSDQNFVDVEVEEEKPSSLCRVKRKQAGSANFSSKYQVVPSAKFP